MAGGPDPGAVRARRRGQPQGRPLRPQQRVRGERPRDGLCQHRSDGPGHDAGGPAGRRSQRLGRVQPERELRGLRRVVWRGGDVLPHRRRPTARLHGRRRRGRGRRLPHGLLLLHRRGRQRRGPAHRSREHRRGGAGDDGDGAPDGRPFGLADQRPDGEPVRRRRPVGCRGHLLQRRRRQRPDVRGPVHDRERRRARGHLLVGRRPGQHRGGRHGYVNIDTADPVSTASGLQATGHTGWSRPADGHPCRERRALRRRCHPLHHRRRGRPDLHGALHDRRRGLARRGLLVRGRGRQHGEPALGLRQHRHHGAARPRRAACRATPPRAGARPRRA